MRLMKNKKQSKNTTFFQDLKEGLEEFVAYKKGKLTLRSELIEIPEFPYGNVIVHSSKP